ncbi:hypothetical protein M1116_01675 [Patescibacteria group bacterium]|nr:hypothetical protein [Patescibacteria group bacterium]
MHFTCRSFIGKSGSKSWCQYWENEPDDPLLFGQRGHLFGLVALESGADDAKLIGHRLINDLNQNYFQDSTASVSDQLKNTVTQVLAGLPPTTTIHSLVLVVVHRDRVFLQLNEGGSLAIIRHGAISEALRLPADAHWKQVSGQATPEDRLLLMTANFYQRLTWEKIKEIVTDASLSTIEENTLSILNSLDNPDLVGASLVELHQDEDLVVTPPPIPAPPLPVPKKKIILPKITIPKLTLPSLPKLPSRETPVFVESHQSPQVSRRQRLNLIVGFLLLVGLTLSIAVGFKKNKAAKAEAQYQKLQTTITKTLSDAFAIKNLNLDTAKQLGQQSEGLLNQMKALKTTTHQAEISQFQGQIQSLLTQTGGNDPTESSWYDTSLIVDHPQYSQIYFFNNVLYLVDTASGRIDELATGEKSTRLFSQGNGLKIITKLLLSNDKIYGVTATNIVAIDKAQTTPVLSLSAVTDAALWNGTLYLLDHTANTIDKVTPNNVGFGSPANWLKDNQKMPANPTSIAINGKVWVLSGDGTLTPFLRGVKDKYQPTQVIKATKAHNLVTGINTDLIAFLDDDSTIYVFKKDGQTVAKFSLDDKKISGLALDEGTNTIYALCSDEKIYKISI